MIYLFDALDVQSRPVTIYLFIYFFSVTHTDYSFSNTSRLGVI
uniref:Uncharacterized protein n=1 Tax=Anguilla anguilla TaxID=7936 RepID=A0A0E9WML9_ANGAN